AGRRAILPETMMLATATRSGRPSVRILLLREFDDSGFVFYTDYSGRKGRELVENPQAALVFYWPRAGRQVRVEGRVSKVSSKESDIYFSSRARDSQLSAWASQQSRVVRDRRFVEARVKRVGEKYPGESHALQTGEAIDVDRASSSSGRKGLADSTTDCATDTRRDDGS